MKKLATLFLFIFIIIISCREEEQIKKGSITGIIRTNNGLLVNNARISLNSLDTIYTKEDGVYNIYNLDNGAYDVTAIVGFDTLKRNTIIKSGETNTLNFTINDPRTKYVGKYKCLRKIYRGFPARLIATDTSYVQIKHHKQIFNKLIFFIKGYSYGYTYHDIESHAYLLNGYFSSDYVKFGSGVYSLYDTNCLISGKLPSDSIYMRKWTSPCDNWMTFKGKKVN